MICGRLRLEIMNRHETLINAVVSMGRRNTQVEPNLH